MDRVQYCYECAFAVVASTKEPHNVTVVACARELSCFLWAAATAD